MSTIVRHVVVTAPPERAVEIERLWKQECAPLMIKEAGCIQEELLRCREAPGEYISVAEWESQAAIDAYLAGSLHEQIKQMTRGLTGASAIVKTYERVTDT